MKHVRVRGITNHRRRSPSSRVALVLLACLVVVGFGGCRKHVSASLGEVDLGGGREVEIGFSDGRTLVGRIVEGSQVRYTRNDSLFSAQISEVNEDWIELVDPTLYTPINEWTFLQRASESSEALDDRQVFATETLELRNINSISLLIPDNRRLLTESIFWAAAGVALGFAGLGR